MKNILSAIIFLIIGICVNAQIRPEAFIGMLPGIPGNACVEKLAMRQQYLQQVDSLSELIKTEISRRNKIIKANEKNVQQQAMGNVAQQYGLSDKDMQNAKKGNKMTADEKKALADKMMQNSMNMSVDELKNVKKMSKDGKEAWAQAYSSEAMAAQAADPKKTQDNQLHDMDAYNLINLQKHVLDSLLAIEDKFGKQLAELDNDTTGLKMLRNIEKWQQERSSLMGVDYGQGPKMEALTGKIIAEKKAYCNKYSPRYSKMLTQYFDYTKSCMSACYRLEIISAQLTKLQTGVDMNIEPGQIGIGKVGDYLYRLKSIFKYNPLDGSDGEK
ncbi:MAG: hypothetical protein GZ094_06270 [Mariniphaga sp.]|nr:hypothetical protein [Mariniphaga sp.]